MLAVPTMFSAAECTWFAGVTDPFGAVFVTDAGGLLDTFTVNVIDE